MGRLQSVKHSSTPYKHPLTKRNRVQKTFHLTPEMARRLNIQAAYEDREMSDIAMEAFEDYLRSHPIPFIPS